MAEDQEKHEPKQPKPGHTCNGCLCSSCRLNCPACVEENKDSQEKWWHGPYCNCRDCH